MTFIAANRGIFKLLDLAITGATDLRQAVFTGAAPAPATIRDWNTLAEVIADAGSAEALAAGYVRADLAGVALSEDDALDRALLVCTAPVYGPVAAGETWVFVAFYLEAATDALRELIGIDVPAATQITNGSTITGPALNMPIVQAP